MRQHTYTESSRHFSHQKHSNTNVRLKKMRLRRYFVWDVGLKCLIACVVCFLSIYISNDFYIRGKSYLSPPSNSLFFHPRIYRCCRVVWATTLLEKRERTPNIVPLKRHCCFIYTPFTTTAANIPLHFIMMPTTLVSRKTHYTLPSFPYSTASSLLLLVVVCLSLI